MNGIPYINGELYSWAQISCNIAGVTVTGITAIEYKEEQETTAIYGSGRYPIGYGKGRITPSGSVTLLEDEISRIRLASPNGRLQDIAPFDIVVAFLPDTNAHLEELSVYQRRSNCERGRYLAQSAADNRNV